MHCWVNWAKIEEEEEKQNGQSGNLLAVFFKNLFLFYYWPVPQTNFSVIMVSVIRDLQPDNALNEALFGLNRWKFSCLHLAVFQEPCTLKW